MRNVKLGDYLLWKGKLAKIIGKIEHPAVTIELLETNTCPNCGHDLGPKQFDVIPTSPLFQENAKPILSAIEFLWVIFFSSFKK